MLAMLAMLNQMKDDSANSAEWEIARCEQGPVRSWSSVASGYNMGVFA